MTEMKRRIESESEFQDIRVAKGGSPRKFQHLIREEYPYLLEEIGDVRNKKILTMGCSTGGVTPFAREGGWVVGVDISPIAIKQLSAAINAEDLSCNAHVAIMDCESLALTSESFDIVLFFGVLHHLDTQKAMAETYRILKPGGKVFMSEPLGLHPFVNLYRWLTPKLRTKYEHPLRPGDFRIMKKYFSIEQIRGFCLTSVLSLIPLLLFNNNRIYELTRNILNKIDDILFNALIFLRYFAWSAVVVLSKEK